MSAQMTRQQASDGLDTIRQIIELANNPKQIIAAHELEREQAALTDAELAKADEARQYIANYEKVKSQLEAEQKYFNIQKANHEQKVSEFQLNSSKTSDFLTSEAGRIEAGKKEIADRYAALSLDQKKLADAQTALTKTHTEALRKAQALTDAAEKRNKELDGYKAELSTYADKLRTKAAKFKAVSAED